MLGGKTSIECRQYVLSKGRYERKKRTMQVTPSEHVEGPVGTVSFSTFGKRTTAPTVVLVHGWMQSERCWRKQIPVLARDHYVVTLDLPGHGRSAPLSGEHVISPLLWPQSLRAVLASLHLDASPIVLAGWSFGGGVTSLYMKLYGLSHVAGIVTFGTSIGSIRFDDVDMDVFTEVMKMNDPREAAPVRLASFEQFQHLLAYEPGSDEYDETYGYNRGSLDKLWKVDGSAVMQVLSGPGVEREVREAKIPLLIVQGKYDAIVSVEVAYHLQQAVPHAKLLLLDCGHSAFLEEAEQVNKALLNFLDSLS